MSSDDKKTTEATPAKTPTTTGEQPVAAAAPMEAIEEDDEFEEFEPSKWEAHDEEQEDAQQWQDNWDDDDIEDDFTKNLRAELQRTSAGADK
mmetsp:Transcript_4669/g.6916  ORF Transcript_4669/g.6916 Transcript_4669/m.6916 type:complete len:92 (+) Transcript_4669:130-405(+)